MPGSPRTSVPSKSAGHVAVAILLLFTFVSSLCCGAQSVLYRRKHKRIVSGSIQNGHREPLRGAVVQVEDEATLSIKSYITGRDGLYRFRNLDDQADYRLWATFRGQRSKTKTLSHFDADKPRVVDFTISNR